MGGIEVASCEDGLRRTAATEAGRRHRRHRRTANRRPANRDWQEGPGLFRHRRRRPGRCNHAADRRRRRTASGCCRPAVAGDSHVMIYSTCSPNRRTVTTQTHRGTVGPGLSGTCRLNLNLKDSF
jgi:hypothetical protein